MQPPERWPITATPPRQPRRRDVVTPLYQQALRHRHGFRPLCLCVGPPAKRRRWDTMTSQFGESDVASGDSYHTPNYAIYNTPPGARSPASVDKQLDPLQSQPAASTPGQMGACNSQVSFSRGHTQRAFRHALLVERYTHNEHFASLDSSMEI